MEYRTRFGGKDSSLEYVVDFYSSISKSLEGSYIFFNHKNGFNYVLTMLCERNLCPQIVAFFHLLCNLLYCN